MTPPTAPRATADHTGLEVLDEAECLRLLGDHYVGRLGLSVRALPVVVPVNYAVHDRSIVMCSEPGAKLDAARAGVVACLEIDEFDPFAHTGWSVLVTGRLSLLTDADVELAKALPLSPWVAMDDPNYLSLTMELISGRRLHRR